MRTMTLPCALTDTEKLERAKRVAVLDHDCETLEEQRKAHNSAMKAKIDNVRSEISDLCHQLRTSEEMREVEIAYEKNWEEKTEETMRLDTGEVVSTRALTPTELQRTLELEEEPTEPIQVEEEPEEEDTSEEGVPQEEPEAADDFVDENDVGF